MLAKEYLRILQQQWKNLRETNMHIFGASGHAKVVIESLLSTGKSIDGVFDDNEQIKSILGYQVLGKLAAEYYESISEIIVAIGNNEIRKKIAKELDLPFGNAIHISAIISSSVKIGHGVAIMANTVVNAETKIGNHVIINTSASVDHDCKVEDFVHIAPNSTVCGGVQIGKSTLVGAGSVIIPNIKIGNNVTIGAGSVITQDIRDNVVVVGHNKIVKNG